MTPMIDSHLHLDLIDAVHPERIQWLLAHQCKVVSWAFGLQIETLPALQHYLRQQKETLARIHQQTGLDCFFLSGIHPRCLPPDLQPGHVADLLMPVLAEPRCLGIGEIGLECGSVLEQEIFIAQLQLARSLKGQQICVGVHTPRGGKLKMTRKILSILEEYDDLAADLVIDHCSPDTLAMVLDSGYHAGITLSPEKTSLPELAQMVAGRPDAVDRIMCNTDSGTTFYEDLITAAAAPILPAAVKKAILHDNAAGFFSKKINTI